MEFVKDSSTIIKEILPELNKYAAYKLLDKDKIFNKSLDNLLLLLYNEIHTAEQYTKTKFLRNKIQPIMEKKIVVPELYGGKFMPNNIKEYIDTTIKYQLTYLFEIEGRKIRVFFGIFSDDDIIDIEKFNKYIKFMYSWLYICSSFSLHVCSKTLNIFLYFTPFKKTIPYVSGVTLGPSNVNTAYTMQCKENNEIVLYREEEWKKVFIHETFHSFGFDPTSQQVNHIKAMVANMFPISSTFHIGEAYVETWARILNVAFDSYNSLTNKRNTKSFLLYMRFTLQIERLYSIQQMCKILNYMGMEYNDIIDNQKESSMKRALYKEDSNIFAYYILTGIFMNNYYYFLLWCAKNNSNIFRFSQAEYAINSFKSFIKLQKEDPSLLRVIDSFHLKKNNRLTKKQKFLLYTARMSAVEVL